MQKHDWHRLSFLFNRCSQEGDCKAYVYKKSKLGNCRLIVTKCGDFGKSLHTNPDFIVYVKGGLNILYLNLYVVIKYIALFEF